MKNLIQSLSLIAFAATLGPLAPTSFAQTAATPALAALASQPYKVLTTAQFPGTGGLDYVTADSVGRRLYVPRGNLIHVFDLDTLKLVGNITPGGLHGVAVDPASGHGFCSTNPVQMFDTKTLANIKSIPMKGRPDGILFEPLTERVYVLSHSSPNVTAIDAKDGTVLKEFDLGGQPEQAQSDGKGHVYIDLEDASKIAVVDANTYAVTATYDISSKGTGPGGLGLDIKNHILFAMCSDAVPAIEGSGACVVLSADDGKILGAVPIHTGTDGGGFNPNTMEAFSSQGDGTLAIIKEDSLTSFSLEQTVMTKNRAKVCTLDTKTDHIIVITTEAMPPTTAASSAGTAPAMAAPAASAPAAAPAMAAAPTGTSPASAAPAGSAAGGRRGGGRGGNNGPSLLDVIVVGR